MRFNILLPISVIATLATGLVIPSSDGLQTRDLEVREGVADDLTDSVVLKREPRSSNAKKVRIAAAKPARAQVKAERKATFEVVAKAHKKTTGLPGRHSTFNVAAAPGTGKHAHTYTGQEVRKAVFDGHKEAHRIKGMSKTKQKKSSLKSFNNRPHEVPHASGAGGTKPLPHMTVDKVHAHHGPGREFPLPNHRDLSKASPARVITQITKGGDHTFRGVISHDQSRTTGSGYNDHFQVKERKH